MEAYIDDMVIKSRTEDDLLSDIQETFNHLRPISMRLNLKKCPFVVEEGKFLGHLITKQQIKANPSNVKAITYLQAPKSLNGVQSLNGKLAALSRYWSKGAYQSLPFFKTLKGCMDKKTFQWSLEAEAAFQKLKEFMEVLPTLTAPIKGEVLFMYITASFKRISAVLLAEREKKKIPIYFVSRVLQGVELNYQELQKLILALVHAARRLRRYFQAHPIIVLTDKPIKQILSKPEKLGRITK